MTEIEGLEHDYCSGKFKNLEKDLEDFIRQHRTNIKKLCNTELPRFKCVTPSDDLAIKLYIIKCRSISPSEEIKLELEEIKKEIWYKSEKNGGKVDKNKVAQEWSKNHAPGWRDYWILCTLYVFERNKEKYLEILNEPT